MFYRSHLPVVDGERLQWFMGRSYEEKTQESQPELIAGTVTRNNISGNRFTFRVSVRARGRRSSGEKDRPGGRSAMERRMIHPRSRVEHR